ncbi:MAG: hypothetical protein KFB93_08945 [Simkaniaceae bacterium]|jgi:chromosome segregation ATPase|nr:MAG: hypothetical protein KFB93_08945 [Simkaniaceae bacterium]
MAKQPPQVNEWVMPAWVEKTIHYIDTQLNWLDLAAFGLGILILAIVLYLLLRKKKRIHVEEVAAICETYENDIQEIKRAHLDEIEKAEHSIRAFKKKLEGIETEFEENLKEQKSTYSKRVQKMEKGHTQIRSTDEMTIYELKSEISRLRAKQVNEVEAFESEIKNLKDEITNSHEGHAKEIERAELEISDLRKQMRALMYRV